MQILAEYLIAGLLVVGGLFGLVGSFGLLKLRDTMQRLHAPTKATTIGVGSALLAGMVYFPVFEGRWSWHEPLIALFLFLTAPITATFLARAHMHAAVSRKDLPETGSSADWATYDTDGPGAGRQV